MVFVLILIRCGAKILKGWYGCTVPDESSFVDVYVEYSSGSIDHSFAIPDEHRSTGYITRVGKSQKELIVVDSSCPVAEVVSTLGHYIQFVLNDINAPASVSMEQLQRLLDNFSYVCGNLLLDIECDEESVLNSVFVKANLACSNPIEIPYYSSGNDPICYFCGTEDDIVQKTDFLPGCTACCTAGKKLVSKRKHYTPKS